MLHPFAPCDCLLTSLSRAIYFQIQISAVLLAETIAPFIASGMMKHSVWLPIVVAPAIMTAGGLLLLAVPETLALRPKKLDQSFSPSGAPNLSRRSRQYAQVFDLSTPWSRFRKSIDATLRVFRTRDVKLLIPTATLTIPVATVTMSIILRYMPLRFGWTMTQTGMVLGLRTGFNVLVLLLFLPATDYLLSKIRHQNNDLVLARLSIVLLVIGQAVFAAAPNTTTALVGLGVLTLGTGAPSLCRAALTRLVDSHSVGRLYGILAVCEMLGYLACAVGFGAVYQVSMLLGLSTEGALRPDDNGAWLALVFYIAAVAYFWCGGMLWVVDLRDTDGQGGGDEESVRSGHSVRTRKSEHEIRVLADGRVTRKCPSLENGLVKL